MHTKEDRIKNSHYAQAICAVVADLKKLTIPAVAGQCEQFSNVQKNDDAPNNDRPDWNGNCWNQI